MGLKFQTLHGVVFSNAPLHGVKKACTYVNTPFFYIVQKPHTQNSKKAHCHANEQQRAKALFEQSHNKPNEPRMP